MWRGRVGMWACGHAGSLKLIAVSVYRTAQSARSFPLLPPCSIIPPRFQSGHGTSYYLKSVRKMFSVADVERATGHLPDDVR